MGITPLPVETVYQTYAQLIVILFYRMIDIFFFPKSFVYYFDIPTRRNLFICSRTLLFSRHLNKVIVQSVF